MKLNNLVFLGFLVLLFSCSQSEQRSKELTELTETELKDSVYKLESNLLNQNLKADIEIAKQLQEATNQYAERFPESPNREDILYKSVLAARGMEKPYFAIQTLSKLIIEYPQSKHLVDYLYEKASIFDFQLNAKEEAKKIYGQIVKDYPDNQWADDSKARLETIDLSDDELIKKFEQQNAQ